MSIRPIRKTFWFLGYFLNHYRFFLNEFFFLGRFLGRERIFSWASSFFLERVIFFLVINKIAIFLRLLEKLFRENCAAALQTNLIIPWRIFPFKRFVLSAFHLTSLFHPFAILLRSYPSALSLPCLLGLRLMMLKGQAIFLSIGRHWSFLDLRFIFY